MTGIEFDEGGEAPCYAHLLGNPLEGRDELGDATLAMLLRRLADAVVVANRDGTIVFWNDAAARVFGWQTDEAVGRPLDLIIPERLRERHRAGYERVMATGTTRYGESLLEVPALHRDGHTISIAFTVTLLSPAHGLGERLIAAVIRDDTARWQERRELRARLSRLERPG